MIMVVNTFDHESTSHPKVIYDGNKAVRWLFPKENNFWRLLKVRLVAKEAKINLACGH